MHPCLSRRHRTTRPGPTYAAAFVSASLLALLLVCWTLGAPAASAHNVLRSSDPADGSTLATPPAELTLVFNDVVIAVGTVFQVTGPDGVLAVDAPAVDGPRVVQPLPADLPAGQYSVIWRVTSADGHPIDGTLRFTAERGSGRAGDQEPVSDQPGATDTPPADATTPAEEPADGTVADDPATEWAAVDEVADDDGGPGALVWVAGGVLLVAAVAVAWFLLRRRSSP